MEDDSSRLLESPKVPIVKWTAVDGAGEVAGEVHIYFEGKQPFGPAAYSIRFGYFDGEETVVRQRQMVIPSWQSLNVMGILMAALNALEYDELCSDRYSDETYQKMNGVNSVIPHKRIRPRRSRSKKVEGI